MRKKGFEIVSGVLEKFRGPPVKLEAITEKTAEWWRSHGREPKSRNPLASGNLSAVDHYLQMARQYEASEKGAGQTLNNRVHAELEAEFGEKPVLDCSQIELHSGILKESFDVLECLNAKDFSEINNSALSAAEQEGIELRDAAANFIAHVRAAKRANGTNNLRVAK